MATTMYVAPYGTDQTPTLTPAQAAARIGTSIATLDAWRAAGRGPMFVRLSDHEVRYRSSDLHDWAARFAGV